MTGWSADELAILMAHYQDNGPGWVGWESLLPGRSQRAIEAAARRVGVAKTVRKPPRVMGDPARAMVVKLMAEGMTPSQIDRKMLWRPGRTIGMLKRMWGDD